MRDKWLFYTRIYRVKFYLILLCLRCTPLFSQKTKQIQLLHADMLEFDEKKTNQTKRLIGNVKFLHDSVYMDCDSAYLYSETNSLEAFGRIHIYQGDTLDIFSRYLYYSGNNRKAILIDSVKLIDNDATLLTDSLTYDLRNDIGNYFNGGKIIDSSNILTSKKGTYFANENMFHFKDSVVLINENYEIFSDTLHYNSSTEISYFFGPTIIVSKENSIYCENGWYDTQKNLAEFKKNNTLFSGSQTISGDSLFYDRNIAFGEAFCNVIITDTAENIIIYGQYANYREDGEKLLMTDSVVFVQIMDDDSLFMHADTLRSRLDSTGKERIVSSYYNVKLYKSDLQGKCDSLVYNFNDSLIRLYYEPILWSEDHQLTATYIEMKSYEEKLHWIKLVEVALIVSEIDTIRYNQIKGKEIIGYLKDNRLNKIKVKGNGETIYYAQEEDKKFLGVNKASGASITIHVNENEFEQIIFYGNPQAIFYPIDQISKEESVLKDFIWKLEERPLNKKDIFN